LSIIVDSGYSTPPRSNVTFENTTFFQPKILTSAELKRRFSPIQSSIKKRRHHLIRKNDSIVPSERNLNMPVILKKLFDKKEEDCIVPISSIMPSNIIHPQPIFNCSLKAEQENSFSISETTMKQKLKILLQKK
jgi:hypothetical protein